MRFILGVRDFVAFYHAVIAQGLGVLRAANRLAKQGAIMQPVSQPDHDPFDDLAFAVSRAFLEYRFASHINADDLAQRRAELVAACDVLATAEHPDRAAERDPVPDGLVERVVDAVHAAVRAQFDAQRDAERQRIIDGNLKALADVEPYDKPIQQPVDLVQVLRDSIDAARQRRSAADGQ